MQAAWVEQTRVQVAAGHTSAREVVAWFACEWWSPRQEWHWEDEAAGTFRVAGDLYRVRAAGVEGGWWVIEWYKVRGNHA